MSQAAGLKQAVELMKFYHDKIDDKIIHHTVWVTIVEAEELIKYVEDLDRKVKPQKSKFPPKRSGNGEGTINVAKPKKRK